MMTKVHQCIDGVLPTKITSITVGGPPIVMEVIFLQSSFQGGWIKQHELNKIHLYVIEPVMEVLLQVAYNFFLIF